MSSTATHDTKRGEDMRARLHVLSEAAAEWKDAFTRWRRLNEPLLRDVDGEAVPDANEEYLLYQTLVGTWPVGLLKPTERDAYRDRILQYMEKALREAKIHTSWMNPSESYDSAVREFVGDLLGDLGTQFCADLNRFVQRIADVGFVNSLAQLVLKATLPGVPDFYQGTELWDFNLVDPDNRRLVDFQARATRLEKILRQADAKFEAAGFAIAQHWPDSDVKLWVTTRCLNARRKWADVFSFGEYIPLCVIGPAADHVLAFARRFDDKRVIAVVPRHFYRLCGGNVAASLRDADGESTANRQIESHQLNSSESRRDSATWGDTCVVLPADCAPTWRCQLSGHVLETRDTAGEATLDIADLFQVLPVALLTVVGE
jgi:(1->4)-alpha-D-glucan 1-alpha-D-glucosylmutase